MAILTSPRFQAFDGNGNPLRGGWLFSYASGTSTDKDTFSDRDLSSANDNPTELDNRGEAVINLDGEYKLILKDAALVEIWTEDEVTGLGDVKAAIVETEKIKFSPISTPDDATDIGWLYGKDVSNKIELHYLDEDDNEIVLTSVGKIKEASIGLGGGIIAGDGTEGRMLRSGYIRIKDGTVATTINCQVYGYFNGDSIAETDDIGKGVTVGDFSLSGDGTHLTIEKTGISGNCVGVIGSSVTANATTTPIIVDTTNVIDDINILVSDNTTGNSLDLTTLVDTGSMDILITYITSA